MTNKLIKNVLVPEYIKGIKRTKKPCPKHINIIGCDTETVKGKPSTMQFTNKGVKSALISVDSKDVTEKFVVNIKKYFDGEKQNIVLFHNLSFDLPIIFFPYLNRFLENEFAIVEPELKFAAEVFCGKIWFANMNLLSKTDQKGYSIEYINEDGSTSFVDGLMRGQKIMITDTGSFIHGSLKKLAKKLTLQHAKYDSPFDLGEIDQINNLEFLKYSMNDTIVQYDLAKFIIDMHKEYDIPLSISIAQMSQYVFTKNFMGDNFIPLPFTKLIKAAEFSYHGGKNGFYLPGPCHIDGVYDIDVNSMYPYALSQMPPMTKGYYDKTSYLDPDYEGIYSISGFVNNCKYPILPDHEFKYIVGDYFKNIWVTSYELKEALRAKEIELHSLFGYIWIPEEGSCNPFKDYSNHFYHLKNITPKSDPKYYMYKLLLNSVYGKLIQNVPHGKNKEFIILPDGSQSEVLPIFKAGGLYNPFLGSLVTGFARAYLHRLEHKFKALDSATDAVKTIINPQNFWCNEMGGVSPKNYGQCLFLRNKLYVHEHSHNNPAVCSQIDCNTIEKKLGHSYKTYALHGFQGTLDDLDRMWKTKIMDYKIKRMVKIREGLKQDRLTPMTMMEFNRKLDMDLVNLPTIVEGFDTDSIMDLQVPMEVMPALKHIY